jgi:hypothetical protein
MIHVVAPRGRLANSFISHLLLSKEKFCLVQTLDAFKLRKLSQGDVVVNFAARGVVIEDRKISMAEMYRINVELVGKLGLFCNESGAMLIQMSSELTNSNFSSDGYIQTKREAANSLLSMSENGLKLACLSLPSIVGFTERKGHVEKIIAKVLLNNETFPPEDSIDRGMLHKHDFNRIILEVIKQKWSSKREISIEPLNFIDSGMIQRAMINFANDRMLHQDLRHLSIKPQILFENSIIKIEGMSNQNLIRLLMLEESGVKVT